MEHTGLNTSRPNDACKKARQSRLRVSSPRFKAESNCMDKKKTSATPFNYALGCLVLAVKT